MNLMAWFPSSKLSVPSFWKKNRPPSSLDIGILWGVGVSCVHCAKKKTGFHYHTNIITQKNPPKMVCLVNWPTIAKGEHDWLLLLQTVSVEKKLQDAFIQFSHCTWPTAKWITHLHTNFLPASPSLFSKLGGSKMIQLLHCRPVELASNLVIIAIPQGIYPGILVKDRDPPKCKSVVLLVIKFVDLGWFRDVSPQAIPSFSHRFCFFFRRGQHTRQLKWTQPSKQRTFGVGEPGRISTWYPHPSFQELDTLFFSTSATRVFFTKIIKSQSDQISKPPHPYPDGSLNFFKNPNKKKKVPYPPPCWVQGSKLLPHLDLSVRPWAVGSRIII